MMSKIRTVVVVFFLAASAPPARAENSEKAKLGEQSNPCGCRVSDQKNVNKPSSVSESKADPKIDSAGVAR